MDAKIESETFPESSIVFETEVITENAGIASDLCLVGTHETGCEREIGENYNTRISEEDNQQKPIAIITTMRKEKSTDNGRTVAKRQTWANPEFGDIDFKYGDTRPFLKVIVISESTDEPRDESHLDNKDKKDNADCSMDNRITYPSNLNELIQYKETNKTNNTHLKGKKPFSCTECHYTSNLKGNMKRHMLIHSGDKPYACTECKVTCAFKSELVTHMRIHSGEKPFSCAICGFACKQKGQLKVHMAIHTDLFHCTGCEASFKSRYKLKQHKIIYHSDSNNALRSELCYKCPNCDYTCTRKDMLKRHMLRHVEHKPFACEECHYRCSRKEQLVVHMMKHTGEQLYICPQCKFTYTKQVEFEKHMASHSEKSTVDLLRPWECPECDYKCAHRAHLTAHMLKHTGEKPFSCPECDYRCSLKGNLKQHMKIHTNEKPFACKVCDYRSIHKRHLERHIRRIHGSKHNLSYSLHEENDLDQKGLL